MQNLQLPAHYAEIRPQELCSITGGGEIGDAIGGFFDSLQLTDYRRGGSIFTVTFTFVPALLFTAVRSIYRLGNELVEGVVNIFQQIRF